MATYEELFELRRNSTLMNKITVACIIAAEDIRTDGSPPANQAARLAWAAKVFDNPEREAARMIDAVLAANSSASVVAITEATDSAIQFNVDAAVNLFADQDAA